MGIVARSEAGIERAGALAGLTLAELEADSDVTW
jgi:hypothetical protein